MSRSKYIYINNEIYTILISILSETQEQIKKNKIEDQYYIYKFFTNELYGYISYLNENKDVDSNETYIYTYILVNFYNKLLIQMINYIHIILSDNTRPTNATIISNIQKEIGEYNYTTKYYKYKLKYLSLLNNLK